jgi:hypothetical protein
MRKIKGKTSPPEVEEGRCMHEVEGHKDEDTTSSIKPLGKIQISVGDSRQVN